MRGDVVRHASRAARGPVDVSGTVVPSHGAMTSALPPPPPDLDPDFFAELGAWFMNAKLLCVAAELGLFERLSDGPRTLDELVSATSLPRRSLRVVVDGLVAMGILERAGAAYANGREAQAFLAGKTNVDLRAGLRLYNRLIYPMWMDFENAVRTGQPARHDKPSAEFATIFSEGVAAWTLAGARALPERYDFSAHTRVLDVGGGTGSYLVPLLGRYPTLQATLFELPPSAANARRRLAGESIGNRVSIVEGDALFDPLPTGHDVVLVAGFVHLFDPEKNTTILRRIREAVPSGAKLLVVDQWLDATHTQPKLAAMLAGTYLMLAGDGDAYSVDDARHWLGAAGWKLLEHRPLAGVTSVVVAETA
jgi:SAM-dependent methyltransferase